MSCSEYRQFNFKSSDSLWRLILVALLLISACAPAGVKQTPTPAASETRVTITFTAENRFKPHFATLIRQFEALNPDITVVFVASEDIYAEAANTEPDVDPIILHADTALTSLDASAIQRGLFVNLKPFIDADPSIKIEDYYRSSLAIFEPDNGIYALPIYAGGLLLAYNKDILDDTYFKDKSLTLEDIVRLSELVYERSYAGLEKYTLALDPDAYTVFLNSLDQSGIRLFGTTVQQSLVDQRLLIEALHNAKRVVKDYRVYNIRDRLAEKAKRNEGSIYSSSDVEELVRSQRLALWASALYRFDPDRHNVALGYLPFPETELSQYIQGQYGYTISRGSQQPQAAWRWLAFLSQQLPPSPASRAGFLLPARVSLAAASNAWQQIPVQARPALQASLARATKFVSTANRDLSDAVQAIWSSFLADELPPEGAADSIIQEVTNSTSNTVPVATVVPFIVPTPEAPPEHVATITFGAYIYNWAQLRALADEFMRNNPDVNVRVRLNDVADTPAALSEMAKVYDCFIAPGFPPSMPVTGTLDLKPLVDADPLFDSDDYPAAVWSEVQANNVVRMIPYMLMLRVIGYNQAVFTKINIAPPTSGWTFEQLLDTAEQLTHKGGSARYGYTLGLEGDSLRFFLDAQNISLSLFAGGYHQPNFVQHIQEIQRFVDFLQATSPHTQLPGYKAGTPVIDERVSGRVGMWDTFNAQGLTLDASINTDLVEPKSVAPPQLATGRLDGNIKTTGFYIASSTQFPQICWRWISFLINKQDFAIAGSFPAKTSIAMSSAFRSSITPEVRAIYDAYLPVLEKPAHGTHTADIFDDPTFDPYWLYQAVDRALQGGDLSIELQKAQDLTAAYLACVRGGSGAGVCAYEVDPDYQGGGPLRQFR